MLSRSAAHAWIASENIWCRCQRWPRTHIAGVDTGKILWAVVQFLWKAGPDLESLFSTVAGGCLVFAKVIAQVKTFFKFGWMDGCGSLHRNQILKLKKNWNQDPVWYSKIGNRSQVKVGKCDFGHLWYFRQSVKKLSPFPVSVTTRNTSINWIFSLVKENSAYKENYWWHEIKEANKNVQTWKTFHDTEVLQIHP